MLKRLLSMAAVVLVANAGALALAARNASGPPDAVLQLTERELRVTNPGPDTTGMTLALQWDRTTVLWWFDRAKLASLGFDCSVAPDAPGAREYYNGPGLVARSAYVVFEYDTSRAGDAAYDRVSWLKPIDAGNDARALRARYADRQRYLIATASVRPNFVRGTALQPAYLGGQVLWLDPNQLYVPQEMQATIVAAVGKNEQPQPWAAPLTRPPRYRVRVEYGSLLLPRVTAVTPLR